MTPLHFAERICYSSKRVLHFSYEAAVKYKDVNACVVEAGVAAGAQVIAFAHGTRQRIYALDSYAGIPRPSNKDDQYPGLRMFYEGERETMPNPGEAVLESTGATVVSLEDFENNLKLSGVDYSNVIPVRGWFEEVLPNFECPPIAILRLDSDLYNSTYVCLKYLYPKVIKGGLIIVDDIQLPGCKQAVDDYFNDTNQILPGRSWIDNIVYFHKP